MSTQEQNKYKKAILERDAWICQCCMYEGEEVHEIQPVLEGGTLDPNNLITLCFICHLLAPIKPDDFLSYQKNFGGRGQLDFYTWTVTHLEDNPTSSIQDVFKKYSYYRLKTFASNLAVNTGNFTLWRQLLAEEDRTKP